MILKTNENEIEIIDKKTMRKRIKHFLKKRKPSGTSIKPESKLVKIQKALLKCQQQYQSVLGKEVVRQIFLNF